MYKHPNPPKYYRHLQRLRWAARTEVDIILKKLPKEYRDRLTDISVQLEDRPTEKMLEKGIDPDAFILTDSETKGITVFLMNIETKFGKYPGEFRHELRKCLLKEIGDMLGEDWVGEDG